jgi:HlyD family secretion protein
VLEDPLGGLTVGKAVSVMRNGPDGVIKSVITELRPLGTFATWQAERVIGIMTAICYACVSILRGRRQTSSLGMTVWIEH